MDRIIQFINDLENPAKEIAAFFHEMFIEEFHLEAKSRYSIPFYYRKSWICYLNPNKQAGLELVFTRGNELSNVQGLLDPKGRKQVSGIDCYDMKKIPFDGIREILHEAIILDTEVPYASKRKL